jgi:hypothetical protein
MNWLPPQRTNWPPPLEEEEEGMGRLEGSFRKKCRMANKWEPPEKGMS